MLADRSQKGCAIMLGYNTSPGLIDENRRVPESARCLPIFEDRD